MQELPARLAELLAQADALLAPAAGASTALTARARVAWRSQWLEAAMQRWLQQQSDLDPLARNALQALPAVLATAVAHGAEPWQQQDVPGRQLVELATGILRGLDAFSGRRSESLPQQVASVLQAAARNELDAVLGCQQLGDLVRQHAADVRPLEQQLIAKERQQRQQLDAMRGASRLLRERIGDLTMPAFAVEFFDSELRKLLQIVHVQSGEASTNWTQLVQAVDTLIWALAEAELDALRQAYGERVTTSQQFLREQFERIHHNNQAVEQFFDALDFHLLSRLAGQNPSMPVQPWPQSEEGGAGWSLAGDPLLKARALRVGDWVALSLDQGQVRARLIDKDLTRGVYLFANLSGLRVARLAVEELASKFADQGLRVIDARPALTAALPTMIEEAENRLLQLQLDAQQLAAQQRQQEAERLQRELAKQRALQAAEARRLEAEQQATAKAEAEARLLADCRQDCRRLQPGAWIELREGNTEISAQLAVILNRTGELLFVDRKGQKVLQADPDALAAKLARGELRIREYGRALDDALQKLVADHRQKLDEWR